MVSLVLTLTAATIDDPVARNAAFMASAKGLTVEYKITLQGSNQTGTANLVARFPDMQRFSLNWAGEVLEYTHSPGGALMVRRDLREYEESRVFPRNIHPFGPIVGLGDIAYPPFLISGALKSFDPAGKLEPQGQETVSGRVCDKLFLQGVTPGSQGRHTFWVDPEGKVVRWHRVLETMNGRFETVADFTQVTPDAPSSQSFYASVLPVGYMPTSIPMTRTRTLMLEEPAVFGKWTDARTGKTVDVAKLAKGVPIVLVFTDPDCELSKSAEPLLAALRKSLKTKGCALIEVSLGTKKPELARKDKDRNVFWDKDGAIEAAYGIPATPYFLMADAGGTLVRGWHGYAKDQDERIKSALLGFFEKD